MAGFLSGKDKIGQLECAKEMFKEACSADRKWHSEALDDHNFNNNIQWTAEEQRILEDERRPCLTFNLVRPTVELIMGMNEDAAPRVIASPVERKDGFLAEVANDVAYWVQKEFKFKSKKTAAFESSVICGRGYVALDFTPDPRRIGFIKVIPTTVPAHEIRLDPACRERDLSDAAFLFWDRWVNQEDFKVRFPEKAQMVDEWLRTGRVDPDFLPVRSTGIFDEQDIRSEDSDYDRPLDTTFYDKTKRQIRIIHMEYWESYDRYYGLNPTTGKMEEFDKKNLKVLQELFQMKGQEFDYYTVKDKKVKWFQFIGDDILFHEDSPSPYDGFSIIPCFAHRDSSGRTQNNFGIVRFMKDPQKEVNKRWSQAINLLIKQNQPGLRAEADAFLDIRQAEDAERTAGGITLLQKGGMAKIQERGMPAFPAAAVNMEQMSQDIMKKITGVNTDLLGSDPGRHVPGVVVQMRQQQGMTILRRLFTAYTDMDKDIFERLIAIIMKYMPDEQILQIIGETDRYMIIKGQQAQMLGLSPANSDGSEASYVIDKNELQKLQAQTQQMQQQMMQMQQQAQRDPRIAQQLQNMQQSLQMNPPKLTMVAPIRDLRNLAYNIDTEEAPGNITQRMFELQIFLEMLQNGMPVDPNIIIEKLDLPETDKQRWREFITAQQQAQKEQAEKEYQLRVQEIKGKMQKDASKAQLQGKKDQQKAKVDEHKAQVDKEKLRLEDKRQNMDFHARMEQVEAQYDRNRRDRLPNERKVA